MMDEPLNESAIVATSIDAHKRKVKAKVRMAAFEFLQNKKKLKMFSTTNLKHRGI